MFDRIKAKEKAKTLLRTRSLADVIGMAGILFSITGIGGIVLPLVPAILIFLLIQLISNYGYYIWEPFFNVEAFSIVVLAAGVCAVVMAIRLLFRAGMNRAALRMNRGDKNVRVIDIILAGDRLGRYIAITLWQALFIFLWNLPATIVTIIATLLGIFGMSSAATVFSVILNFAAAVWRTYITCNKICQYYFAYCVSEDDRDQSALDCIRESSSLMVDHKWELFVTMLSFIGWSVVSLLPFGNTVVVPYKYLTYTSIYEQLTGNFKPIERSRMPWLYNAPIQLSEEREPGEQTVEILSGEFAGTSLTIRSGEEITIGRDPKRANMVVSPANTSISGLHCKIRYDGQNRRYVVTDYSSNGTYVNNDKLIPERGTYAAKGSLVKLADGSMLLRLS